MSREVCPVCGLPKDLCICKEIAKEQQVVNVSTVRRKGIDEKEVDLKGLSKELKSRCAVTKKNW